MEEFSHNEIFFINNTNSLLPEIKHKKSLSGVFHCYESFSDSKYIRIIKEFSLIENIYIAVLYPCQKDARQPSSLSVRYKSQFRMLASIEDNNNALNCPITSAFQNSDRLEQYVHKIWKENVTQEAWMLININIKQGANQTGVGLFRYQFNVSKKCGAHAKKHVD